MNRNASWLPDQPLPKFADKATSAAIVTHHFFPISPRTLERWPLTVRRPNKAVVYEVAELMKIAESRLEAAYAYKQMEGECYEQKPHSPDFPKNTGAICTDILAQRNGRQLLRSFNPSCPTVAGHSVPRRKAIYFATPVRK